MSFPDHYKPNKSEILKIINEADKNNLQIIMTEKDYLRDKYYEYKKINYDENFIKEHVKKLTS